MCWNRSGAVVTEKFNFRKDSQPLVDFLWYLARASETDRGGDPTVRRATEQEIDLAHKYLVWWKNERARPVIAFEIEDGWSHAGVHRMGINGRPRFSVRQSNACPPSVRKGHWQVVLSEGLLARNVNPIPFVNSTRMACVISQHLFAAATFVVIQHFLTSLGPNSRSPWRPMPQAALDPRKAAQILDMWYTASWGKGSSFCEGFYWPPYKQVHVVKTVHESCSRCLYRYVTLALLFSWLIRIYLSHIEMHTKNAEFSIAM